MEVATTTEKKTTPTVFFIPGAWHEPWVFDSVRSILSARGFETEASSLATIGSADPSGGLHVDAAKIRSALTGLVNEGKEVVLVAHSYGGIVASNSVDGLGIKQRATSGVKGGIIMILYLAAFAIPVGTNLLMNFGGSYAAWWNIVKDFFTPIEPLDVFYDDVEASLAEKAVAALRPMPLQIVKDISAYDPRGTFEAGYIFARKDQALPISTQNVMFSLFPAGSFSARLDSSHSPFLSMPDALADTIENATKYVLAKRSSE
ncbi:Alpha/beta hydrolase fold-1 [Xylaria flabelliformis]|nr:Alpha/beta hydrolase fold-1 [Xylaria flabelliformis]